MLDELARDCPTFIPFDQEWLYGMSLLADVAVALDDTRSATVLYRLLLPWASLNAADFPETTRGSVSRYLGLLAMTMGHPEDAETHYQRAISMNREMRTRPWLAQTQRDYARMLLRRNAPGDRIHAHELLNTAFRTFGELDMNINAADTAALVDGSDTA
jgi:hypothetical protein